LICERYAPYLAGHAGGELRDDTSRMIAAHVKTCTGCREEVERQQRVIGGLKHLGVMTMTPPPDFLHDVLERVHGHGKLGTIGAALPLPLAEGARRVIGDDRVRRATTAAVGAAAAATETRARKAATAAATAAVAAGGIAVIGARRRRRRVVTA
jgi:hypothetical protein